MSEILLSARGLGKAYRLFARPEHRLRQLLARGQRQHYEEFWALRNVSLELHRGETLGVIGENGAGKSTLLRLLCGTLRPTEGSIRAEGKVAALLELGSGFNPNFTGRENVWLNAAVLGLGKAEIAARFDRIADFAGIGEFMDLPVRLYSSGMQARLGFAVSAHVDADILIVDEVLAVGDQLFKQKCVQYFERFRARGTLLFVSHDTATVAKVCERALWLERGTTREFGPAEQVCANYLSSLAEREEKREAGASAAPPRRRTLDAPDLIIDRRIRARNPIEVSEFDPHAPWHGHGGARIRNAYFSGTGGAREPVIAGGEEIELHVECIADREILRPIVGFLLRDRLGQNVFGDNTYLASTDAPPAVHAGESFHTCFRLQLPFLARGDYTLTVAITEGTQEDHTHLHWMEEVLLLRVAESPVRRGIVGIPANEVRIDLEA